MLIIHSFDAVRMLREFQTRTRAKIVGRYSASSYGLDGPVIESQWGRDVPQLTRSALGPTQPPI